MTELTKIEKETIILFSKGESVASIYNYNARLKKLMVVLSKKYLELCHLENSEFFGGVSHMINIYPVYLLTATLQLGAQTKG